MKFDYGKDGLELNLESSWNVTVFKPEEQPAIPNPVEAVKIAIKNPIESKSLKKLIESKEDINQICIVVSDATRPVPSHLILEGLVEELNEYGIGDNQIMVLIATGLHRPSREEELKKILGEKLKNRLKTVDHVATDQDSMKFLGLAADNTPIFINKHYCESDFKILTGYVEPHFFFGFAGGRKSIIPGIAGAVTIQANHSAENIAHKASRFGFYKRNPMHKHSMEAMELVGADFIINVCINEKHQISVVAAGNPIKVHETLVRFQKRFLFKEIKAPFDIVVCGNGGYPLDLNLYQAVKSMAIGEMAVKEGGTIISVNECSDGVGIGQEKFKELIFSGMNPKEIYDKILNKEIIVPDQWEIQILARALMKAEIYVISKLKEKEIGNIGLKYSKSVEEAIKLGLEKHGRDAKILILPNGPQLLPLLKNN